MNQTAKDSFWLRISGIRWRWVLPVSVGVVALTYVLLLVTVVAYSFIFTILVGNAPDNAQQDTFARIMGLWGTPALHVLLTVPAAAWVARKVGVEPALHGVLIGLTSAAGIQLIDWSFGPLNFDALTKAFILALGAGWLGGRLGEATLRGQKALYRTSRAISAARSPQDIVAALGEHLVKPEEVSQVALWKDISEDEASIEFELLTAWASRAAQVLPSGLRLNAIQVPVLASLRQQAPALLKVGELPASERAAWERQGIRSAILLPLITSSDARVGLLMVASRKAYGFSRIKVRRYLTIGAQVALALENLRLLEEARHAGVLRERQRLAHEIHDTLAQGFSSIVMKLEAAEEVLPGEASVVQGYLDHARHTARDSLAEARRLMWALRPESLERTSLPEALARLIERWSEECGVAASATVTGTTYSLAPEIEVALFRVAQEALANCRKHARANNVSLTLSYLNG